MWDVCRRDTTIKHACAKSVASSSVCSDVDIARYAPDTLYSSALWTPTSYALQLLLLKRVMGRRRGGHPRQRPTRAGRSREGGASAAAAAPGASSQPAVHGQPLSAGGGARFRGHVQDTSRARALHVHGKRAQLAVRRRRQSDSSSDSSSACKKEKTRVKRNGSGVSPTPPRNRRPPP